MTNNILVIKLRGVGDVILSIPVLRALRNKYPNAHISYLVEENIKDILTGISYINEIIPLRKTLYSQLKLIKLLRSKDYDISIDLFCNPRSALISYLSGAKKRIGLKTNFRDIFYNIKIPGISTIEYAPKAGLHIIKEGLGVDSGDLKLELYTDEKAESFAEEFIKNNNLKNKNIISISPSASWETKSWGEKNWAGLINLLKEKKEREVVLLWGPKDGEIVENIMKLTRRKPVVIPKTNLKEFVALIKHSKLLVCNDNSSKHIAVAFNVPTITVFGGTNPLAWHPAGDKRHIAIYHELKCRPCDKLKCPYNTTECLSSITAEEVYNSFISQ